MVIKVTGTSQTPERQQQNYSSPTPFDLFGDFFNNWVMRSTHPQREEAWTPSVDILVKEGNIIIQAEIPGVEEKDLDLKLDGRTLTIHGIRKAETEESGYKYHRMESSCGPFSRSFDLPASADAEHIKAGINSGVLTVTIPQKPEAKPRSIKIGKA